MPACLLFCLLILTCIPALNAQSINSVQSKKDSSKKEESYTKGKIRIARTGRADTIAKSTLKLNETIDKPQTKTNNTAIKKYETKTTEKRKVKELEKKYENIIKEYNAILNAAKTDKKPITRTRISTDYNTEQYEYKTTTTVHAELPVPDSITNTKNKNRDSAAAGTVLPGLSVSESIELEKKRKRDSTYAAYLIQDSISREKNSAAIGFGYGYGSFGESFSMTLRIYFISISVLFTDLQPGKESITPLDIDPPHNDYTHINTRTARYGVTAEYYIPISKYFSVFPTLGASAIGYKKIPKSNLTGIYYKPQSQEEVASFCAGVGVEFRLRLGTYTVGRLQCAYRNTFGTVFTFLLGK